MDARAREKIRVQDRSDALLQGSNNRPEQSGLLSGFSAAALSRAIGWVADSDLSAEESASTLFRFFRSRHVRDLKLIFTVALFVCLSHIALVLLIAVIDAVAGAFDSVSACFSFIFKYVGPGIPIYGVVMGWAYQSASKRLGIVDLFACEIGTLCRVGTIFDMGKRYVDAYFAPPSDKPPSCASFVSKEEYFPVFASNSRDLELLEESVVNYITEFYTYMKALRDALRRLAETNPPQATQPALDGLHVETPWHTAMLNVIYLMYLGYESARKAIRDLVEYQPARAERLIVILLTELKCYAFLRPRFALEDLRWRRLQLREAEYRNEVIPLYDEVMVKRHAKHASEWLQAERTIPALESRYKEALNDDLATASKQRRETLAKLVIGPPLICDSDVRRTRPAQRPRRSARGPARTASVI